MTPRTDWKEIIAPDETARFEGYAQRLGELQKQRAQGKPAERALHTKPHLAARAELTVLPDLPPHARVGIFAAPASYPAWVRFSNGSGGHHADQKADIRGLAVKLLGVPGKKLIPGMEDACTQDFLMIQTPVTAFANSDEFIFFVFAALRPLSFLPRLIGRFGFGRTLSILSQFSKRVGFKIPSLAGQRYWSVTPIRFGDHAAKFSVLPALSNPPAKTLPKSADYLGEELTRRLAAGAIEFDFAVQFYCDPQRTPIEDLSVEWREEDAPFVRVARLVIPQQDLASPAALRQREYVQSLSFDPWHAPVEFRPLGDIMRARSIAYRVSTQGRGAAAEPETMLDFA